MCCGTKLFREDYEVQQRRECLALLWFCFLPVMAQNQKVVTSGNVTGRVIDQNGDPLVGVSVYVKGSMAGI